MTRVRCRIRTLKDHALACIHCRQLAVTFREGRSDFVKCDLCGATQDLEQALAGASRQVADSQLSRLKSFMDKSRVEVVIKIKGRYQKIEPPVMFAYPSWMESID
jgi:hypothetical protein